MRTPFVVAFVLAELLFATVIIAVLVSNPEPRRPEPWVVLIPILLLCDYYLTILFAWLVKRTWSSADLSEIELNPMWKRHVAKLRLVSVRHLIHVICTTSMFLLLSTAPDGFPRTFFLLLFSYVAGQNMAVVAKHIQLIANLRLARRTQRTAGPDQVLRKFQQLCKLNRSTERLFCPAARATLVLLVIGAVFLGPAFLCGGALGVFGEWLLRHGLIREARRAREKAAAPALNVAQRG